MEVTETHRGDIVLLTPGTEVDVRTLPAFDARVDALLVSGARGIVFDLTSLALLPSTVAGFLVSCAARVKKAGGRFAVAASPRVRRTLATLGIEAVLTIRDSVEAAERFARGP